MHGTYETIDGRPALRFERDLGHPVDDVWHALTTPEELEHWFPTTIEGDWRVGATLSFAHRDGQAPRMTGEVEEVDPRRLLAFTWGGDHLRFELEPLAGGERCRLRLTVLLDQRDKAARDAAGWHVCLDRLQARLAGGAEPAPDSSPTETWRERYDEYGRRGLPTGAAIPS